MGAACAANAAPDKASAAVIFFIVVFIAVFLVDVEWVHVRKTKRHPKHKMHFPCQFLKNEEAFYFQAFSFNAVLPKNPCCKNS